MRVSIALLTLLAGCAPEGPRQEGAGVDEAGFANAAAPVNAAVPAPPTIEPPTDYPGLSEMSPYRRREFERGWSDCMNDRYDRERQGESYRIGCMAAEEAKEQLAR